MKDTIIRIIWIAFLFVFIIINSSYAQTQTVDDWVKRGDAYYDQQNYKDAVDAYSKAINLNPQDARIYYYRGGSYEKLGNCQQVVNDCDKIIEIIKPGDPLLGNAYVLRGACNFRLGNSQQALKDFDKAIELNPKDANVYYNKACMHSLAKNVSEACSTLKKSIELGYNKFDYIKKDSDMDNIRNSSCYKEIISAAENKTNFTFLDIGSNDNIDSAIKKLNNKFTVINREGVYNNPGFHPATVKEWSERVPTFEKIRKMYVSTFMKGAEDLKDATISLKLRPTDTTLYLPPFDIGYNTYRTTMDFSGFNKKILRMNILFRRDFIEDVVQKIKGKYGAWKELKIKDGKYLVYWESENDVMLITTSDDILFDYRINLNRPPESMSQLVIHFGQNISAWSNELIAKLKRVEEEKMKKEQRKRKNALSDF